MGTGWFTTTTTDRRRTLTPSTVVVEARWQDSLTAFLLDGALVWVLTGAAVTGVWAATQEAVTSFLAGVAAWPAVSFGYGLTTAHRRSLGQRVAGTRTVRIADGTVPGFWRAGIVMLNRMVGVPFVSVLTLSALSDAALLDHWSAHLSIDVRATRALVPPDPGAQPIVET